MKNVIIPGFASDIILFKEFINNNPGTEFIDLSEYTYDEIKIKLNKVTGNNEKLNIFGWSLGSLFALRWTAENPDTVSSLFLTGATARFCEKEGYENGVSLKKLDQMIRLVSRKKEAVLMDFFNNVFEHVDNKEHYIDFLIAKSFETDHLINGLNELRDTDLLEIVKKIEVPVFIFQGKNDRITALSGAGYLNDSLKNSQLVVYNGGHSLFLENTGLCSEYWRDFLCTVN